MNWKSYKDFTGGHAISTYVHGEQYDWKHLNTYPKSKYNEYSVQHWYALITNGVYWNSAYFVFKDETDSAADIKKRKLISQYMNLASDIYHISKSEKTKKVLKDTNDYFRSVWFSK